MKNASIRRLLLFHIVFSSPQCGAAFVARFTTSKQRRQNVLASSILKDPIFASMEILGFTPETQEVIKEQLERTGLLTQGGSSGNLVLLARDFVDRPEVFSSFLQSDFDFEPLVAHQTRAVVLDMMKSSETSSFQRTIPKESLASKIELKSQSLDSISQYDNNDSTLSASEEEEKRPIYKAVVVNEKARRRRSLTQVHDYGLPKDYAESYPILFSELENFLSFMTQPTPYSQEDPIRPATAEVYVRHCKQFFGWHISHYNSTLLKNISADEISLFKVIIPNKEQSSAKCIIDFILWLRSSRNVSVSYEANILRGLIKLLKFRFAQESSSDPTYGGKTFDDIPVIREVRKIHRDANKRQKLAPRSSDEQQKWLSWPDYLQVVQEVKHELIQLMEEYRIQPKSTRTYGKNDRDREYCVAQRRIGTIYQRYLILAFFASVPDRQRTIRELEIGRTFVKDKQNGCWAIKHAPEDYKTGKSYGERPAMQLSPELSPSIDDFLENWRPSLKPSTDYLFLQPRTGNPLTANSIYQIVSRATYKSTGKKTNPHLLRDMIVTHVRQSDASEKQLEALALFMGHSIQMQRSSYDRRTLHMKVAPAVELMQHVNKVLSSNDTEA
jgi:hypothetical protein